METIELENGKTIEIDDTPYVIKGGVLYVYCPTEYGCDYLPMGKVKEAKE